MAIAPPVLTMTPRQHHEAIINVMELARASYLNSILTRTPQTLANNIYQWSQRLVGKLKGGK